MTHAFVLKTFIVYLFVKALFFLPLAWAAVVFWWSDEGSEGSESVPSGALAEQA